MDTQTICFRYPVLRLSIRQSSNNNKILYVHIIIIVIRYYYVYNIIGSNNVVIHYTAMAQDCLEIIVYY